MSESDEPVGEIQDPREQICIQWNINDYFSSISQRANTSVFSPDFHFANESWNLEMHPHGFNNNNRRDRKGWINIYLNVNSSITQKKIINCTLGIKCLDKSWRKFSEVHLFSNNNPYCGDSLMERSELLREKHNLVPGDTLTVVCRARLVSEVKRVATQTQFSDGVTSLTEDLKNLLIHEKDADVTVKVKDKIFRVHKLIIGSRSSVLSAMFKHDMKENTTGEVCINDCEPEIFYDFLLFLYSGKVEKLSSDNVEGLYYLADKYILKDLTSICLNFMKEHLDLDNVCAVAAIADRHHDEELMKSASEMIKMNLKDIIQTKQWVKFLAENSDLAAELLKKALLD